MKNRHFKKIFFLNQSGLLNHLAALLVVVLVGIVGTYLIVAGHADSTNPYRGNLVVTTYLKMGSFQQPIGGVLITPIDVGTTDRCPKAPSKTDQTKGANYGMVHYNDCPVAYQSTNNHAKQYDVTATIPSGYVVEPSFMSSSGARATSAQTITQRVTLNLGTTSTTQFIFMPNAGVVGNITNTSTRNRLGGGAWITNMPSGYYLGKIYDGWRMDTNKESSSGYEFGQITRPDGTDLGCAWIEPGVVTTGQENWTSHCAGQDTRLQNRDTFGMGFNCAAHACVDGAPTNLVTSCNAAFYYNYKSGNFMEYAGIQTDPLVYYRFTTLDGQAAVVRSSTYGWGYIAKACISGYPQGGTPKT